MAGTSLRQLVLLGILIQAGLGQAAQVERERGLENPLERSVPGYDVQLLTATDAFASALNASGVRGGVVMISEGCHDDAVKQTWYGQKTPRRARFDRVGR